MKNPERENIDCPCCRGNESRPWASENGYTAVKCISCGFVYVNPRPSMELIAHGAETGTHVEVDHGRTAIGRRSAGKVRTYSRLLGSLFHDVWQSNDPITWLDVGAGYGEVIEAIGSLAQPGSAVQGVEPMQPKADVAKANGLDVTEGYLSQINSQFQFISLVNVFSHIPDFRGFLVDVKKALVSGGELFVETGNIGDLETRKEAPSDLDLPDHLVFAGEKNIVSLLNEAGFEIITIQKLRRDGLVNGVKNVAKKLIGRKVSLRLPYTSAYRTMLIRARLNGVVSQ